ncbi:hypothetical protein GCM10010399_93030 [Dactylosporangium fulvum]|uniref:Helix-turn-helix transcriptional regulator n=1 Tax=Dactylosporangium fulvum TaxID=53359 RepID=A0ABY5W6X4_9ACTN|nr:helix-turn-helix transcriptional regulator [Dactylosporangium fulvum]UWP85823.1 helix-turn-helix transcriptional regulator [Dactylosporangium fulvum]
MGWQEVANAVVSRRVELGMQTRKKLAEKTGLTVKTLGEIERADRTSYDPATLVRVEQALEWPAGTILSIVGDLPRPASVPRAEVPPPLTPLRTDPVVGDLADLLNNKSKLPPTVKQALTDAVEHLVEAAHKILAVAEKTDDPEALDRVIASIDPHATFPTPGLMLDATVRADMDERSRAALVDGMNSLLHLGQQAMLAHSYKYGPTREEILRQVEEARAGRGDVPTYGAGARQGSPGGIGLRAGRRGSGPGVGGQPQGPYGMG